MNPLEEVADFARRSVPGAEIVIDRPARPDGEWFLDAQVDGHVVTVQWRPAVGFGVSASAEEAGFGEGPDEQFTDASVAARRVVELLLTKTFTSPPTRGPR